MGREHRYQATVTWTGNLGEGTAGYRSYSWDHEVSGEGKPVLPGSSDPAFRGDPGRWSPEELLVAALSQCHMLWFLHLCAVNGIAVTSYTDDARGTMAEGGDGGGEFTAVTLRPRAAIADSGQDQEPCLRSPATALRTSGLSVHRPEDRYSGGLRDDQLGGMAHSYRLRW